MSSPHEREADAYQDEITRLRSLTAELVEALDQAEALLRNGPRFETTDGERFLQPIRSREAAERIAALLSRARAKEDT